MSNIAFVLRSLHRYEKMIIPYSLAEALLGAAVPFMCIFLPKLIIDLIVSGTPVTQIIIRAGSFTIALGVLHFMQAFCIRNNAWRSEHISFGSVGDLLHKNLTCEYRYLENAEKQAMFARLGQNIYTPRENCYAKSIIALTGITTGTLGFALYFAVLSGLAPWIALLLTITASANYFAIRRANQFEHNNKDNWAPLERKIAYLLRVSGDYEYGKDIRLYRMKKQLASIASRLFAEREKWDSRVQGKHFSSKAINALTILLRDGAAYAFLIYRVAQGDVSIADFMLYIGAISGFSVFITSIIENIGKLGGALLYVADIRAYYDGGCIAEPENPVPIPDTSNPPVIEFRNVSFSYGSTNNEPEKNTLDNLSFTVGAGEKAALVGLNGAGKTTLVKLLCGFYTPDEGEILIYGIDIRCYRRHDLFKLFSAVFQEEFVLPFTLAENITPSCDDERGIWQALERAGLAEHFRAMPKGLQSLMTKAVREDGIILSGGQKQKLFLARALYKDAPILVLDEPTAALDPIAESEIYESYHSLTEGKTSIFISHRLASTRFCDKILFLANGCIAEAGSHLELMSKGGQYAKLFEIQSQYYREVGS